MESREQIDLAINAIIEGADIDDVADEILQEKFRTMAGALGTGKFASTKTGARIEGGLRARSKTYRRFGDWAMKKEKESMSKKGKKLEKAKIFKGFRQKRHAKRTKEMQQQHGRIQKATKLSQTHLASAPSKMKSIG